MIGTIRWNIALGSVGFVLTFMMSILRNVFVTTLINSIYSFIILFLIGYAVRWAFAVLSGPGEDPHDENEMIGGALDLTTPEEDESLQQLLKDQLATPSDEQFQPLVPKRVVKQVQTEDPQAIAKAIRHMADE